jgi:hypothetical protein
LVDTLAAAVLPVVCCGCSYYAVVPLSLLPASWFEQQQWQRLSHQSPAAAGAAVNSFLHQLPALPEELNRLQKLVGQGRARAGVPIIWADCHRAPGI